MIFLSIHPSATGFPFFNASIVYCGLTRSRNKSPRLFKRHTNGGSSAKGS